MGFDRSTEGPYSLAASFSPAELVSRIRSLYGNTYFAGSFLLAKSGLQIAVRDLHVAGCFLLAVTDLAESVSIAVRGHTQA